MRRLAVLALLALTAADAGDTVIPAEFGLVEGVAWDARGRQMFAGSVEDGALLVREGDHWRRAILPYRTAGLSGMAVDARRGVLWLASGIAAPTRARDGFRGLIGVTTLGFEAAGRIPLPAGESRAQPGDVALAPDGTVYVSDSAAGGVYVCRPGCTVLAPLLPPGSFRSAQGMAVSRDGRALYVADYPSGLWRIDLKRPKGAVQVAAIKGIDGLARDGDALVAIVNGNGRKVLRLTLDAKGAAVARQELLATPTGPGEPTLGVVAGDRLLYVADAQWDRFDAAGRAISPPRDTHVASVALPPGPRPPEARAREERTRR